VFIVSPQELLIKNEGAALIVANGSVAFLLQAIEQRSFSDFQRKVPKKVGQSGDLSKGDG
jgi:hypothetical protein